MRSDDIVLPPQAKKDVDVRRFGSAIGAVKTKRPPADTAAVGRRFPTSNENLLASYSAEYYLRRPKESRRKNAINTVNTAFKQASSPRNVRRLSTVFGPKFCQHIRKVVLDGALGNDELVGDIAVGEALG